MMLKYDESPNDTRLTTYITKSVDIREIHKIL